MHHWDVKTTSHLLGRDRCSGRLQLYTTDPPCPSFFQNRPTELYALEVEDVARSWLVPTAIQQPNKIRGRAHTSIVVEFARNRKLQKLHQPKLTLKKRIPRVVNPHCSSVMAAWT
jgi:hypothetical protein